MDIVLKLRELRRLSGMNQREVALRSGVGEKTISSFETGERIDSLKISQLKRLLRVYGVGEEDFFSPVVDLKISSWHRNEREMASTLLERLDFLPSAARQSLLSKFDLMIETASEMQKISSPDRNSNAPEPQRQWEMLTSRN